MEDRLIEIDDPVLWVKLGVKTKGLSITKIKQAVIEKLRALGVPYKADSVYWPHVVNSMRAQESEFTENYSSSNCISQALGK